MAILDSIHEPADLRSLSPAELAGLADEIRTFLIANVSRTGGHLGSNLGVVELTLAIHRVFDSPRDAIVFDTGHQAYVHKILTGRQDAFPTLRQENGLSGYPNRAESPHDWVENSHASASLSWADGLAMAFALRGEDRYVVAVVGDGALTGGMAWEALNNIATRDDLQLVIVVNDNGRSYTPTVGGLATQLEGLGQQLAGIRTDRRYERTLHWIEDRVKRVPLIGPGLYGLFHGFKTGVKDVLQPQGMFSDLGLKYVGPVNGHDERAVELALQQAKRFSGPVLVHCITEKGHGFAAAENDQDDHFHSVGRFDELTGEPLDPSDREWTHAFGDELARIGATDDRVVAVTAAMLNPTGLGTFARHFPERVFDVGIAEQHAVTSAAGLAAGGFHPVVAVYASFLNRAFDQVLMDVGLHRLGVTFVLDRAGVTGPDGASHNGMWDASLFGLVPGLRMATPRDEVTLGAVLREAVHIDDVPTLIRFPKGVVPADFPVVRHVDGVDVLREASQPRVLVIGYGMADFALDVADRLGRQGIDAMVVDPVWALPVAPGLLALAGQADLVVTIEDNLVLGGLGSHLEQALHDARIVTPVRAFGLPQRFLAPGRRSQVLARVGLTPQDVARRTIEAYTADVLGAPVRLS